MTTVTPKSFSGWSMSVAQMFGSGPKFTVTCGQCEGTFKKRIPMVDRPGVQCPYCCAINRLGVVIGGEQQRPRYGGGTNIPFGGQ